ncbi:Homeodomain-like protein [Xylona heveae TC161]|uniref:Homeodomain-like protein n=1 Tax=Xylona heveae (strain CBS 132557 / TC161) TaxID=1328760 RepID=A0A164ZV69_XYLHT|nr:Homeodomain-like protein [Xylona heveae TC161]KZF19571.1 Homeodomain-like protein [Xylona heveae TC161]
MRPIAEHERRALREWHRTQYPRPRHAACIDWFERQFHHRVSQSTVSESLSNRYSYLDSPAPPRLSSKPTFKNRAGQWPLLEAILVDWQRNFEQRGGHTTGQVLIDKAREIWPKLPQYSQLSPPRFGNGWLARFKGRHNIRLYRQRYDFSNPEQDAAHDEEEDPIDRIIEAHLAKIQSSLEASEPRDHDQDGGPEDDDHDTVPVPPTPILAAPPPPPRNPMPPLAPTPTPSRVAPLSIPTREEALSAVKVLLRYLEHEETALYADVKCLTRLERSMEQGAVNTQI